MDAETEISQETNNIYWFTLQSRISELRVVEAFRFMREKGIEPILIKGLAAARYYPEKWRRQYSDVDLCVEPASFERAKKLAESPEGRKYNIDLHKGLRHLDLVPWDDLARNSELIEIENIKNSCVRVLRPEDHLRVLCTHWLTDGGAYKERLWDIFYLIENRPEAFDWGRCLDAAGPKRRRWVVCCIGLAHKYLNLNIKDTPVAEEAENLPLWLTKTVETEWNSTVRLKPLYTCLNEKKVLWEQIKKRIPPNPIQATVEMEGDFDETSRLKYQWGSVLARIPASVVRLGVTVRKNFAKK
jgi:hypothetical protein